MPSLRVKCPHCGTEKVLRQMGRYSFKCYGCGLSSPLKSNIVAQGVSLKLMRAEKKPSKQGVLVGEPEVKPKTKKASDLELEKELEALE